MQEYITNKTLLNHEIKKNIRKKLFFKSLTIGLIIMFAITLIGMSLFPYKNSITTFLYKVGTIWEGSVAYTMQFQFLTQTMVPRDQAINFDWEDVVPVEEITTFENYTDTLERNSTQLKIPAVSIDGNIVVGKSPNAMNRGFWHYPNSGLPGTNKNTIIFGHRFFNVPPATDTFYYLDRVSPGQQIYLNSEIGNWTFVVTTRKIIDKYDISILHQPDQGNLILITCNPLWTSDERLVIIAKPKSKERYI